MKRGSQDTGTVSAVPVFSVSVQKNLLLLLKRRKRPETVCPSPAFLISDVFFFRTSQPQRADRAGMICFFRDMTLGRNTTLFLASGEKAMRMVSSSPK